MRIGILDGQDFSEEAVRRLTALGDVFIYDGSGMSTFLADKEVLFVRLHPPIDATFIDLAKNLKVLVSPTTALTHIDLTACTKRSIEVISLRGRVEFLRRISATPEHALGLILALLRNYKRAILRPETAGLHRNAVRGRDIKGKSIGILGFGRVATRLSHALTALEATVYGFDVRPVFPPDGVRMMASPLALAEAVDIFVVAASYDNGSPPIVDAALLAALKGRYLVNIARGELWDETAVLHGIREGWYPGVATDVVARETSIDNKLTDFVALGESHNVIVTPHVGGATYESSEATELHLVEVLIGRHLGQGGPADEQRIHH